MVTNPPRRPSLDDRALEPYPLRQSLSVNAEKLAALRDNAATEWISKPDHYLLVDDGEQLTLCATDEQALEEATPLVAAALGASARFGTPRAHDAVRLHDGARLQPVMLVRVQVMRAHAAHVREELARRGARLVEEDPQGDRLVLRAEAPLAALIGTRKFLCDTTNARFELWSWLARYESTDA
ncbi:Translation elongation factors (GTPases) [Variovorax sp. HW608]|uniref:hypothetical protein n=1 Tax=Variovorax sp. HW608 TaxID=1034889 RepID=UPI00081F8ADB|nr:hypothetical protein [Variovorax sp. HW608]SCK51848.1 Translation elongation factors (GTPases) [Variovorax sp. HW608]